MINGMIIRVAQKGDAESTSRVHVKAWQETYHGMINQEYLDNLSFEKRLAARRSRASDSKVGSFVVVDSNEGEVVGFCDCGKNREPEPDADSEIYAIYLLERIKKSGVGTLLFREAVSFLKTNGFSKICVWVLRENLPARKFYEKMGGVVAQEKKVQIGTQYYTEVCYIWNQLPSV